MMPTRRVPRMVTTEEVPVPPVEPRQHPWERDFETQFVVEKGLLKKEEWEVCRYVMAGTWLKLGHLVTSVVPAECMDDTQALSQLINKYLADSMVQPSFVDSHGNIMALIRHQEQRELIAVSSTEQGAQMIRKALNCYLAANGRTRPTTAVYRMAAEALQI
jgi:hypothetical protein